MKTPSRILIATLVAAIAFPLAAQAAKGDRKNKKDDSSAVSFETADKNKDGKISKDEFVAAMTEKLGKDGATARFDSLKKANDKELTKEEYAAATVEPTKKKKRNR